ncbi:MAG: hypothetical protein NVS9B10_07930 [Nevskia sp.]
MPRLIPVVRPLALLAAALALTGCASSYGAPINGERALSPEEQRLQAVETKLADLTRRFGSSEANRDQKLASDLGSLRGSVEQLRYDFDASQRRSQELMQAYDARLKVLETAQQASAAAAAPPAAADGSVAAVPPGGTTTGTQAPPTSAAAEEEAAYLKSFDLLKAGKYDEAIRGFNAMLAKFPQGNYSDNALYWTGESYNIKKDYPNALTSYRALLEKFPASPKVPDALLKTGIILQDQKKTDQARTAYQRVIKEFPNSSSATQARNRLAQLR